MLTSRLNASADSWCGRSRRTAAALRPRLHSLAAGRAVSSNSSIYFRERRSQAASLTASRDASRSATRPRSVSPTLVRWRSSCQPACTPHMRTQPVATLSRLVCIPQSKRLEIYAQAQAQVRWPCKANQARRLTRIALQRGGGLLIAPFGNRHRYAAAAKAADCKAAPDEPLREGLPLLLPVWPSAPPVAAAQSLRWRRRRATGHRGGCHWCGGCHWGCGGCPHRVIDY
jgi:hypothetical protein